jgi:hypothetical protein
MRIRTPRPKAPAWALALLVALAAPRADALSIGLVPAASVVAVGDSVEIALEVSGLVDGAAPSLGVYDVDLTWDASALDLDVVAVGDPLLGDQLDLSGLGVITAIAFGPGTLSLFEQSLDSAATLDALQAGAFTLATLTFTLLDAAGSAITLSVDQLGDANGRPLAPESVSGAVVSAVPEPRAAVLWLLGLLLVSSRIRRSSAFPSTP